MRPFQKALGGNTKLIVILAVSLILRWVLIFQGGQYYFPDEVRYLNSREVAASILHGNFQKALSDLTVSPEHIGYRIVAVLPAIPEVIFGLDPAWPAVFFSFFSVLNLFLIWKVAHRSGMWPVAADYALLLAASCLSLMYYARHLLPYDLSLSFGLFALYIAIKKGWSVRDSIASGAVSFLCFVTYNGYWPIAGFAFLAHALFNSESILYSIKKMLFFILGVGISLAGLVLFISAGSTSNVISEYLGFAGSVTQGDYAEGWKLPFEFAWHTEGLNLLLVGGLILYVLYTSLSAKYDPDAATPEKPNSAEERKTAALWSGGILFIYASLAISSTFLRLFVVYGRTVRQIFPLLVLLSGFGLGYLEQRTPLGKKIASSIVVLILIQASWNIFSAYSVNYPIGFIQEAQTQYPAFAMSQKRTNTGAPAVCQYRDFLAVQVKYIYPEPEPVPAIPGDLVLSREHPLNFLPYQYEGYTPEQRQVLREEKIEMELYRIIAGYRFNIAGTPVPNCVAANP